MSRVTVVGGGLAGSEAAWQLAVRGVAVTLFEMRPLRPTPAHATGDLAELVCSNSLGSDLPDRSSGLLKSELRRLGSMVLAMADATALPAGGALAVDREEFARRVTAAIEAHPRIQIVREEVTRVPEGLSILATGPLTSPDLAEDLARLTGKDYLYFYDALSPIVIADSIDMSVAFRQSRYGRSTEDKGRTHDGGDSRDDGDYINCPLSKDEFDQFAADLLAAERIPLREFEQIPTADAHHVEYSGPVDSAAPADTKEPFFEGCLPIEVIAARGPKALAFGPMRPVGLSDPRTGRRPYAVVQLRQDNAAGTLYNLVGFQTNIRWPEQERVLRTIPGLGRAQFVRLGQMHRNTFINAPTLLTPSLALRTRDDLFFAGQITGIEGYVGNIASGLVAGVNAARLAAGDIPWVPPPTTMLGALCRYVTEADAKHFQPMKANFGIMPPLDQPPKSRTGRNRAYAERALAALEESVMELTRGQ